MINGLIVGFLAIFSGCIQAVTGFGGGIVNMLFMPSFYPLVEAAGISGATGGALAISIARRYRRQIRWKMMVLPLVIYLLVSTLCVRISLAADVRAMKMGLGAVLVVLGIYFLFAAGKFTLKRGPAAAIVCGVLGGILGGFFSIGGPPLALYFLGITKSKEEYLGTLDATFTVTNLYLLAVRIFAGIITASMIFPICCALAGILVGSWIGGKIVNKLNIAVMKKCIYAFLIVSGAITFLKAFLGA